MSFSISKLFSGGVSDLVDSAGKALDVLFTSDEQRMKAQAILDQIKSDAKYKGDLLDLQFNQQLDKRIADQEGTAKDLLALPFIGRLMIFLRGAQRPIWGFGVLFMDFQVFSGVWILVENSKTELSFFIVNFLVLGFLFGERAVKNILPLVNQFLATKGVSNAKV